MPTFETDVPPGGKPAGKGEAQAAEFRPRRREQWQETDLTETFDPAPIPPAVKSSIDKRVNEIMRQCRGPDETFFAIREWWSMVCRIFFSIPTVLKEMFHHSSEADEADDEDEGDEESEEGGEEVSGEAKPRDNSPQQQRQQSQHRGRRGGRRHGHRGGRNNKDHRNNSDRDRNWRNEDQ